MNLSCPHCQGVLINDPALAGALVQCPHCGGQMQMPAAATQPDGIPYAEPAAAPSASSPPSVSTTFRERRDGGRRRDRRLMWAGLGSVLFYLVLRVFNILMRQRRRQEEWRQYERRNRIY